MTGEGVVRVQIVAKRLDASRINAMHHVQKISRTALPQGWASPVYASLAAAPAAAVPAMRPNTAPDTRPVPPG